MSGIPSRFSDPRVVIGRRSRLLHIEDDRSNLTLVEWILQRQADVELVSAMRGRHGLELAHEHQPDLIVLDLQLPDMTGETVLQCLRADVSTYRIPSSS